MSFLTTSSELIKNSPTRPSLSVQHFRGARASANSKDETERDLLLVLYTRFGGVTDLFLLCECFLENDGRSFLSAWRRTSTRGFFTRLKLLDPSCGRFLELDATGFEDENDFEICGGAWGTVSAGRPFLSFWTTRVETNLTTG